VRATDKHGFNTDSFPLVAEDDADMLQPVKAALRYWLDRQDTFRRNAPLESPTQDRG
jgi:hypothetical protein